MEGKGHGLQGTSCDVEEGRVGRKAPSIAHHPRSDHEVPQADLRPSAPAESRRQEEGRLLEEGDGPGCTQCPHPRLKKDESTLPPAVEGDPILKALLEETKALG
jgi:hypothetical protein